MEIAEQRQESDPAGGTERRDEYRGVLRFYELAKRQEWQVRELPWSDQPPIPEEPEGA